MENPLKMGWFGGYPYFRKHAYVQNIGEISESSTGSPPHRPKILLPVDQAPFDQRASKQNPPPVGGDKDTLVPTQTHAASIGVDMQHFLERILCREEYFDWNSFFC